MHPDIQSKIEQHERFWRGEGPSLILIPPAEQVLYDLEGYPARFHDPRAMWESEMERARPVMEWPTDGIPTVRPNLGVIFIPAIAGLSYSLPEGQMPWPGEPLDREQIRAAREVDVDGSELLRLAREFYEIHAQCADPVAAYQADNQGVFDIAHLLYGDEIFYDLASEDARPWVEELFDICRELYVRVTERMKELLGEARTAMIHGHGSSQGVWFRTAGVRMSEDTPTLLSPEMLEQFVLPEIRKAAEPFGGVFVHYCGRHESLFELLCRADYVRAIDLGNPEYYDTQWLMQQCGATGTVLHSRLAAEPGETWEPYVRRLAAAVRESGTRCLLRATVFPDSRDEAAAMCRLWHELTS